MIVHAVNVVQEVMLQAQQGRLVIMTVMQRTFTNLELGIVS